MRVCFDQPNVSNEPAVVELVDVVEIALICSDLRWWSSDLAGQS